MNKTSFSKGKIVLSFCFVFLCSLVAAIAVIALSATGAQTANAENEAQTVSESEPVAYALTGDGSAANPYLLDGDNTSKATAWAKAVSDSGLYNKKVYVKLASDWVAAEHETFTTSFASPDYTSATTGSGYPFSSGRMLVPSGTNISLDLNGHTIDRGLTKETAVSQYGTIFYIEKYSQLEVNDSTNGNGKITGGATTGYGGVFYLYTGAQLTINGGHFCDNYSGNASGVIVLGSYSTLIINGGEFHNNNGTWGSVIFTLATSEHKIEINGGKFYDNVAGRGGVLHILCGDVVLNGGEFYNNSSTWDGGVIHLDASYTVAPNLTVNEGVKFHDNSCQSYYGGILSQLGTVSVSKININGGDFYNNTAKGNGGIFYVVGNKDMAINGGNFYNNKLDISSANRWGVILYNDGSGTIELNGGKFYGNDVTFTSASSYQAYGLFYSGSKTTTVTVGNSSGGPEIYGNGSAYLLSLFRFQSCDIQFKNVQMYGNASSIKTVDNYTNNSYFSSVSIEGPVYDGYRKNANGTVEAIPNIRTAASTSYTKGTDGLYRWNSGVTTSSTYFAYWLVANNYQSMLNFTGAFTGKIYCISAGAGIFTTNWGKYNSGNTPATYFTTCYASNYTVKAVGTGTAQELSYVSSTSTANYVALPSWEDGGNSETPSFEYTGANIVVPVKIGTGSAISSITRTVGTTSSSLTVSSVAKANAATGMTDITVKDRGKYVITVGLSSGYTWTGGTAGTQTLTFYISESIADPTWADGTTATKYFYGTSGTLQYASPSLYTVTATTTTISTNNATVSNGTITATAPGYYTVTFTIADPTSYRFADGASSKVLHFYLRPLLVIPTFADGNTSAYATLTGSSGSVTFTMPSEGIGTPTISGTGATISGNKITFTATGTYTITFSITSTAAYLWSNYTTTAKTITLYVERGYADSPAWSDGTTTAKFFDYDSASHTVNFTRPANTTLKINNTTVTASSYSATNIGTYELTYTLASGYMWADGSTAATKTLTFIIGSKVEIPTWEEGSTDEKYFEYTGSAVQIYTLPEGVTVTSLGATTSGNNVISETTGRYYLNFYLKDGYVWADGTDGTKTLTFTLKKAVEAPTWSDGTTATKTTTYTGSAQTVTLSKIADVSVVSVSYIYGTTTHNYAISSGSTSWSTTVNGNTISLTITDTTVTLRATAAGEYGIVLDGGSTSAVWAGTTDAAQKTMTFNIAPAKSLSLPTWSDGSTDVKYLDYSASGSSVTVYTIPSAVKMTVSGNSVATISGSKITVTSVGTYTVTFTITDTTYGWADGSVSNKTLTFYVRENIPVPVFSDGTTDAKTLTSTGANQSVTFTVHKDVTIACTNAKATISSGTANATTGLRTVTVTVSAVGTYTLSFALPSSSYYVWSGTTETAARSLSFNVVGATAVSIPTWSDGTHAGKTLPFNGYSASNPLTLTVNLPANVNISEVVNSLGANGSFKLNGDGTATITITATGSYKINFYIDTTKYYWTDGTIGSIYSLTVSVRNSLDIPTWADDDTPEDKTLNYEPNGYELQFNMPAEGVAVSCSNTDAVISGNKIIATKPGTYTITFRLTGSGYSWNTGSDDTAAKTLTFYITGGEVVEIPTWSDNTTDNKTFSLVTTGVPVSTGTLPAGVSVKSVTSTSTAPTYNTSGNVLTVTANAVGTYTITFEIDTTKYVWADGSTSATKTLVFYITDKQVTALPTWDDGTTENKVYTTSGAFTIALDFDSSKVQVSVSPSGVTVSGTTISVPAAALGTFTVTFTLTDPATYSWSNNTTAPRTLTFSRYQTLTAPEWHDGGTEQQYFAYSASGNTVTFNNASGAAHTVQYIDTDGITRTMTKSGTTTETWTYGSVSLTITLSTGAVKATTAGTYVIIFTTGDNGVWADNLGNESRSLSFTINPQNITKVDLPTWAEEFGGGSDELTFTYKNGSKQTVSVKANSGYVISGVTSPATFSGNTVTFTGVGEYTITLSLANVKDYCWADDAGGTKTLTFVVTDAPVELEYLTVNWVGGSQPTIYNNLTLNELRSLIEVYGTNNNSTDYNDGAAITGYEISGELTAGKATITVTVEGVEKQFTVEVTAVMLTGLKVEWIGGAQGSYLIYTSTDPEELKSHITVKAIYNNNPDGVVLAAGEYDISAQFVLGNAANPVTVTYNGVSESFNVKVEGSELAGIVATYTQTGTIYSSSELSAIATNGTLVVTAKFSGNVADKTLSANEYTLTGDLTKGACQITVTYNGKTTTFTVNVSEVALISISASFDSAKAGTVFTTTSFDALKEFITVTAEYGNSSTKSVTAESYKISGSYADGFLTVTYEGKTATFEINAVSVAVESIFATYSGGSVYSTASLDELKKNLTVVATYNDKSTAEVTDFELNGDLIAGSTCKITVSYNGKTATFDVVVEAITLNSISAGWKTSAPTVYTYTDIEDLRAYLKVTATLSTGSKVLGDNEYELTGDLRAPSSTITITYGGKETSITVSVTAPAASVEMQLSAAFEQGNVRIYEGSKLDVLEGYLTVTATYGTDSKTVQAGSYILSGSLATAGECEITVEYDGKSAKFTVNVSAIELVDITAQFTQQGTVSDSALLTSLQTLVVTANYTDGTYKTLSANEYTLTGDLVAGTDSEITVSYEGKSATFTVKVAATPVTFELSASFDAAKFGSIYTSTSVESLRNYVTLTATYSDSNVKNITGFDFDTKTLASGSNIAVTVSFGGKTATFYVNVLAVELDSIVASFNPGTDSIYTSTSVADLAKYLTVTGINNDGSSYGTITLNNNYKLSGELKAGKSVITLTVNGKTTTFEVDVTGVKVSELKVTFNAGSDRIFSTASLDSLKKYFTVTAVYNDSSEKTLTEDDFTLSGTLVEGTDSEITVSYNGASKTCSVSVESNVLTRIEVTYSQSGTIYSYNTLDDVFKNGTLTVTAHYLNGNSDVVTSGYTLAGSLTSGNCLVTVTYGGKSDTFEVTVTAITLVNITAELKESAPELFTTTALTTVAKYLTVTAHYSDSSTKELTADEIVLSGALTAGNCKLTVSYDGKTANVTVNVTAVKLEGIAAEATNLPSVFADTTLAEIEKYVTVLATYTDGKIVSVTGFTLSGDLAAGETCTLTVSYGGLETSLDVRVEAKELDRIDVTYNGSTVSASTALEDLDITVIAHYSDGTSAIIADGYTLSGNLVAGTTSVVTVTYGNKHNTVSVTVDASVTLESITATLGNAEIYTSTSLNSLKSVLTVEEVYSDGTKKTVSTSGYTLSGSLATAGECDITITLISDTSKTTKITVTVLAVELQSITATFDAESAGEILITATLNDLKRYLTVNGLNNNGTEVYNISAYTLSGDIAEGECVITVEYNGKITTFTVTVVAKDESGNEVTFKEITATVTLPAGVEIYPTTPAEELREYLDVYAVYTSSTGDVSKKITSFDIAATLKYSGGKYYVTVSYDGKTFDAEVNVTEIKLAQINADFRQAGEIFTSDSLTSLKDNLTVTGINNDGSVYTGTISANDYTLSGELSAGKCKITVNYQGLTATFEVTVTAVSITELEVTPDKDSMPAVYTTTDLDTLKQYLMVTAIYNDHTQATVTGADYTLSAELYAGRKCTVTVTYNGVSGTFEVEVASSVLTAISASYNADGSAPAVYSSTDLDSLKEYLEVTAQFSGNVADKPLSANEYTLSGDLTKGLCTVTVTYNGKTTTFSVNVTEVTLVTLSATFDDKNAPEIYSTTSLESLRSYITVLGGYSDANVKTITEYTFADITLRDGENTVTVYYGTKSATFTLNITGVKLDGISATFDKDNAPKIYAGTDVNTLTRWLTVSAHYTDNKLATVYDYKLSLEAPFEAGKTCTVTVSYGGKIATFDVTVEKKTLTGITAVYSGATTVDNNVTLDDLAKYVSVTATYDDGTTENDVQGFTLSGTIAAGTVNITVNYSGETDNFTVTVTSTYILSKITAVFEQGNTRVYANTSVNSLKGMLTVYAHYVDSRGYAVGTKVLADDDYQLNGTLATSSTVTVSYRGLSPAYFTVNVTPIELDSLTAVFNAGSANVTASTQLNGTSGIASMLTVTGVYNNGTLYNNGNPIPVNELTVTGDLKAGQVCTLTVTVGSKSTTFDVYVSADVTLESITAVFNRSDISGTVYTSSDISILIKGLLVTANYSDGTRVIAYPYYKVECDLAGNGDGYATIYVTYEGKRVAALNTVYVEAVKVAEITANFNQNGTPVFTTVTLDEFKQMLDDGDVSLTVVGVNNDGSFVGNLTADDYIIKSISPTGEVTVEYIDGSVSTTFNVILIRNDLKGLTVEYDATKKLYASQSTDDLKNYLVVKANYTDSSEVTIKPDDYNLVFEAIAGDSDSEKVGYKVTVDYFGTTKVISETVYIYSVKLDRVEAKLDASYKNTNIVIYDSMSAAEAAALLENYLTITGYYNDTSSATLALGAFIVSGQLSDLNNSDEATVTLTYATDANVKGTFNVAVTRVSFSKIEISFSQPVSAKVYTSYTLKDIEAMIAAYELELDVTAYFNNGTSRVLDVTEYNISVDDSYLDGETLIAGEVIIQVTYTHSGISDTKTFKVDVEEVDVKSISATLIEGNTVYTTTTLTEFYKMISVMVLYNNGKTAFLTSSQFSDDLTGTQPFISSAGNTVTVTFTYGSESCTLDITVQKAAVTIDTSGMGDYTFGDNLVGNKQVIDSGAKLLLNGVEVTDATVNLVYSNNEFENYSELTGGKITVTIKFAGDAVYAAASTTVEITVNKATVDFTGYGFELDGAAYNGDNITYSDTTHSFVFGTLPVGVDNVNYKYEYTRPGASSSSQVTGADVKNAGTYVLTATFVYNGNYTGVATMSATLVIEKAQAVIDITNVQSVFTYTGKEQSVTGAVLSVGDSTDQTISYTVGNNVSRDGFKFTHVSEAKGVTVTISVPECLNYLGAKLDIALIVTGAALTITANDSSIVYGEQPKNNGISVSGWLEDGAFEDAVTVAYSYDYSGSGGLIGDVGKYNINVSVVSGDLSDYRVTFAHGTLEVTEKEVNVNWTLTDVTYDGAAHTPLATFTNIYGNTVLLTVELSDTDKGTLTDGKAVNAGIYTATVVSTNKNYVYSDDTKTFDFEIKKATISVSKSGDSWFLDGLDFTDRNALITLDALNEDGGYEYIRIVGDQNATITISYSDAALKGNEPVNPMDAAYHSNKPLNYASAGPWVVCYKIEVANHETYYGKWSLDILDGTAPDAKFIQIIFTSAYVLEYNNLPETEEELAALAEELFDNYIDTSMLGYMSDKQTFLANLKLVLRADNDNLADNETGCGNYSVYFEWKDDSSFADWVIMYKADNNSSDSNVGKLQITKKQLTATWSETSFVANGNVHLPTLVISGFNDGSTFELELEGVESKTYTIEKDGKTLTLTVSISGDLTAAGAHIITLTLDNENFEIEGGITAISVTAPTVITVTWDNTSYISDGTVHLPTATLSDGTNTAEITITSEMVANGGGTVEITLGDVTLTVNVTITGSGSLLKDAGKYTITLTIEDERYTLPAGSANISVDAPAATTDGLSPLMIGLIVAIAVIAFLLLIVIIVVIKRKPTNTTNTVYKGSDDGFDDYVDE